MVGAALNFRKFHCCSVGTDNKPKYIEIFYLPVVSFPVELVLQGTVDGKSVEGHLEIDQASFLLPIVVGYFDIHCSLLDLYNK